MNITTLEILASKTHVFFTPESARDFRDANRAQGILFGEINFMREMEYDFFNRKCGESDTFSSLPTDDEIMMRIMRDIPNFGKGDAEMNAREKWENRTKAILRRK